MKTQPTLNQHHCLDISNQAWKHFSSFISCVNLSSKLESAEVMVHWYRYQRQNNGLALERKNGCYCFILSLWKRDWKISKRIYNTALDLWKLAGKKKFLGRWGKIVYLSLFSLLFPWLVKLSYGALHEKPKHQLLLMPSDIHSISMLSNKKCLLHVLVSLAELVSKLYCITCCCLAPLLQCYCRYAYETEKWRGGSKQNVSQVV